MRCWNTTVALRQDFYTLRKEVPESLQDDRGQRSVVSNQEHRREELVGFGAQRFASWLGIAKLVRCR